ncbi:CLIP domain-containing serine protease 14D isoform X2 [Plutella xylostella]|uniref:CLIP domain-containing serine protease 14D isoform X2 n=1 Tax=Plutella xylostella TaxID=51655 RepID=UPI00203250B5|nr:CLIP domain-containing serine protease 14D isoform X2 [Plutella xylostella]
MQSVWLQLLSLCVCQWSVLAQFGSISLSIGLGDSKNDDDPGNSLDFRGACPPNTSCVPISSCALLGDLLDVSCFSSDKYFHRLNQLTCGQVDNEDYVCCPSCDCGRVYQRGAERCGQSMVRGVEHHGLGAHPWVARIGFTHKETGNVRFACSGSIISKRVVLTAAHCALAKPEGYKLSTIVVGEYDIGKSPDCSEFFCAPPTQALKVEHVIVHPGYEQKIFRHDIALIVLKEEVKYSVTAAPVCLNEKPEIVLNERASLVGWGKLSGQNSLVSRQQQLQVPLVPLANCERIFGESVPVHEGQLCAGGEEGRDACSGFGGAPLLLNRDGKSVQIGIVSFGSENCGSEGVPSVYTNIAHYYRWIIENSPSS